MRLIKVYPSGAELYKLDYGYYLKLPYHTWDLYQYLMTGFIRNN